MPEVYFAGLSRITSQKKRFDTQESSQRSSGRGTFTNVAGVPTCYASHATILMTDDGATTRSNLRSTTRLLTNLMVSSSLIVAATCNPCVQATVTETACTTGRFDGPTSLSIAAAAGGKARKRRKARNAPRAWQNEDVDNNQDIYQDNQTTNNALIERKSR
ncbi:hypothetical protein KCU71_g188, partial [Aureobasidium melanogenum]